MSLKAVVDTNIIISGAIKPRGTIGAVLQRLRQRTYALLLSRATLDEIVEVLHRPHLRRKYQLSQRTCAPPCV
ncbi:MAG: putative toxin-antitoxin system toxin component, PIN family [Caldilinea sp.]